MTGSLQDFAERVLLGTSLADKLAPPPVRPVDAARRAVALPAAPGRPLELPVARGRRPTLPKVLRDDRDRAALLRSFANHELLALELFALALLRFPDAPPLLRRAWAATMAEEQAHLAAYLERLAATGEGTGPEPLSTHFWDVLAPIGDPGAFVTGMALVLEQANLDFSAWWRDAFAAAGDPGTAAVLARVHDDEIRHVRVGLRWLRRLERRAGEDDWDTFVRCAPPGLGPARARGPAPDLDARRRAGLDERFLRELVSSGGSRGRVPRLYLMNAGVEDELAGRTSPGGVADDLAALPMFLAEAEDLVLAPRPSTPHLADLAACGLPVPGFCEEPPAKVAAVRPWAASPGVSARFAALGAEPFAPGRAAVYGKDWAAEVARELLPGCRVPHDPADLGVVCRSPDEVDRALAGGRPKLVKAALSASGRHRIRAEGRLDARGRAFVERSGTVVVEPWVEVRAELSVHAVVEPAEVRVLGVTRFGATGGVFRGVVLGPPDLGLPARAVRFLHGDGADPDRVVRELARVAREVGRRAAALGHTGPLSVDALLHEGPDGLVLEPISEVNPRVTMGRLALELRRRLAPGACGIWWFVPVPALARAGLTVPELCARLGASLPRELRGGRLARGALPTTDPGAARALATVALVAPSWDPLIRALRELTEERPSLAAHLSWVSPVP